MPLKRSDWSMYEGGSRMQLSNLSDSEYTVTGINLSDIFSKRYCIFDLEATGANPETDHITQIGAVIVENNRVHTDVCFNSLVRSPKRIPEPIEKLTGITNADMEAAPDFSAVYEKFVAFAGDSVLVTQAGYEFDWPLVRQECERNRLPIVTNTVLDVKALFSYLHPEIAVRATTSYLAGYYNVDESGVNRHNALEDSLLIARILLKQLEEFRRRKLDAIVFAEPVRVRRVKLTPLS